MRYNKFPSKLFSDRRAGFAKKMKPGSLALFFSNDPMSRNGDQFFPFRQHSALFAMTGIEQPGTILILLKESSSTPLTEILFIVPQDPSNKIWNGERLTKQQASAFSGIKKIKSTDGWDTFSKIFIKKVRSIYIPVANEVSNISGLHSQNERMYIQLKNTNPHHAFINANDILKKTLMIKHPDEINGIKKAAEVTGLAFERALNTVRPGMMEFELEAELTYVLHRNGCQHAFEPIIASEASACILHYIKNNKRIRNGTLILLDYGAEYGNIAADVSRTIPANGKFSPDQKRYYMAVLRILNHITMLMRPGISIGELNLETSKRIESELTGLKIISRNDIRNQDKKHPLWRKYFMHGVSHHLGYDVHDLSDRDTPLSSGMVLTCEPGIYIPELKLGIRLENDILITRKGPENLTASIPIEPDEIENIMNP